MSDPVKDAAIAAKNIKIKILRDCKIDGQIRLPGHELLVSEADAKEFCDKTFPGYHPFYGHMPEIGGLMGDMANPLDRKKITRAVRIA